MRNYSCHTDLSLQVPGRVKPFHGCHNSDVSLLEPKEPAAFATDEALLSWLLETRWAVAGGDNRDGSEFSEIRTDITLSEEERRLAVARLRELLIQRDARNRLGAEALSTQSAPSKTSWLDEILGAAVVGLVAWGVAAYAGWGLIRHDEWSHDHDGLPFVLLGTVVLSGVGAVWLGGLNPQGRQRSLLPWLSNALFVLLLLVPLGFVVAWFVYAVLLDPLVHR